MKDPKIKSEEDNDPDDEVLSETPPDVISDLGFDPLEFEEEDQKSESSREK